MSQLSIARNMQIQNQYIIDTNVLLEDPDALFKLRNGNENTVYIPYHVLLELDKFKKNAKLAHIVARGMLFIDSRQVLCNYDCRYILPNLDKPEKCLKCAKLN